MTPPPSSTSQPTCPPPPPPPPLDQFVNEQNLAHIIQQARLEDLGPDALDLTTKWLISPERQGSAVIRSRQDGILAGMAIAPNIAAAYDSRLKFNLLTQDAQPIHRNQSLAEITGPMQSILAAERVILNFLTHLSGVATTTSQYVQAAQGRAKIYDTRKTIPTLRGLQKYAVVCGGGYAHRFGLYDAVLVKDNHLAAIPKEQAIEQLKILITLPPSTSHPSFIEVEVDHLDQLHWLLPILTADNASPPRVVLLDNMSVQDLKLAVAQRNQIAPRVLLEASGGVTLDTVAQIADTGVDRIAIGALTHSAPAIDIGLDHLLS